MKSRRVARRAAVGFTVKSGCAALVPGGPAISPCLLDSRGIELSDPGIPEARQTYHDGFGTARRLMLLPGLTASVLIAMSLLVASQRPVIIGLDHIPVAVHDLERAVATYDAMGFALKPGLHHANGIRNAHVKFPDGAGIELLTAPEAVDALSAHYVEHLSVGEGPAFVSFHARDTERLHAALGDGGYKFRHDGAITKLAAPEFAFLFVIRDNRSPTDRPEHFDHANGAVALRAVWVATENGEALARLLVRLGGRLQRRQALAPDPVEAMVIALNETEVVIVPKSHQLSSGRPVIGASFRVRDLLQVRRALGRGGIAPWAGANTEERIVIAPPDGAHGLWLEFRAGT